MTSVVLPFGVAYGVVAATYLLMASFELASNGRRSVRAVALALLAAAFWPVAVTIFAVILPSRRRSPTAPPINLPRLGVGPLPKKR